MDTTYHPSVLRRIQLMFTKWPQDFPSYDETYLFDEQNNRFDTFKLRTGSMRLQSSGHCEWAADCEEDGNKFIANYGREFKMRWWFRIALNQIPKSSKKVFFHTRFESYGTPQKEFTVQVR